MGEETAMDEAEKNRLREYIKSKQVKPEKMTPEREAELPKSSKGTPLN